MEKQILKAVEEVYRKGLQDVKGLNDISSFLLTSQIVAHEVANKFCQPLVTGRSEQLLPKPCNICKTEIRFDVGDGLCAECWSRQ